MKNSFGIFLIMFAVLFSAMSQEAKVTPQKTADLIKQIELNASQRPGWDDPSMAIENPHILKKMPDFIQLRQEVNAAFPQILDNMQLVAPTNKTKAILFIAFQSLPPDNYLQFLEKSVGLAESNIINKQVLGWALFPGDKNVRGILEYNYDKPVVRDILQRVEILYASDPNMVNYCKTVLSGESKRSAEKYFNENPNDPRPGPALQNTTKDNLKASSSPPDGSTSAPSQKSTIVTESRHALSSFPIIPVGILVLAIIGVVVVLLRRKSP